jgi:hypothetical protein
MNTELYKECLEVIREFRSLNIRPKMKLITTNGKPHGTFDLRLLNSDIKMKNVDQ